MSDDRVQQIITALRLDPPGFIPEDGLGSGTPIYGPRSRHQGARLPAGGPHLHSHLFDGGCAICRGDDPVALVHLVTRILELAEERQD